MARCLTRATSWTRMRQSGIARTRCTLDARPPSHHGTSGGHSSRPIAASRQPSDPLAAAQRTRQMTASGQASAGLTVDRRQCRSACMKRLVAFALPHDGR